MDTRRILIGALSAPLLLLSACGGDDSIADPPVLSAPTSSTPTGPPKQESAAHFIRRFARLESGMENTGETDSYKSLTRQCDACISLANQVKRYYSSGGFVRWGGWDIKRIARYPSGESQSFAVHVVSSPTKYRESEKDPVKRLAGGPATEIVTLRRSQDSWIVTSRARLGS